MRHTAILTFEDGTVFYGQSIGIKREFLTDIIFHTAMTGYQEIITDPSYKGQTILFTTPHIGTTGIQATDYESTEIWADGVIMRNYSPHISHPNSQKDLQTLLLEHKKIGISGIDTRAVIMHMRKTGAQKCHIMTNIVGEHLEIEIQHPPSASMQFKGANQPHIVVIDLGIKEGILEQLNQRKCTTTLISPTSSFKEILRLNPDGIVVSNGPGDPLSYDLHIFRHLIHFNLPLLGICLGHQLLGLASGATTIKLPIGHQGSNHPIINTVTRRIGISSQNHCYVIDEKTLPPCLKITHRSLLDGTIAGFCYENKPIIGFQGHPEASAGPHDFYCIFDDFINRVQGHA